jgi:streptomycin 6-kinase
MQTLGMIRSNSEQRQADIAALENATHSPDPAQHTELATLQRVNQALVLQLKAQQEANQISQAYALQLIVAQKQQQDTLKTTFQRANQFQSGYTAVSPSYAGAAAAMRY